MKVKELIEKLSGLDYGEDTELCVCVFDTVDWKLSDYRDKDIINVVRSRDRGDDAINLNIVGHGGFDCDKVLSALRN